MLLCMVFISVLHTGFSYLAHTGPKFPPTKGEIWPKPQFQKRSDILYVFRRSDFTTTVTNQNCEILRRAVERYTHNLNVFSSKDRWSDWYMNKTRDLHNVDSIKRLEINLTQPCEEYPYLDMGESYILTVSAISTLTSASVWGILRGLETWLQLFYISDEFNVLNIKSTEIIDYPKYKHRGLLIDTGRHFLSLQNILLTLDALEMNKMNVLHWHIVDDQSFPYQSERFPDLSGKGAYHPSMVYTKDDIKTVINYARDRGIRVIPEFDVPGHTRSWGESYQNVLTKCYKNGLVMSLGPMDPIRNHTYKLLRELFEEVQDWFPDKYFHVGGDEVHVDCWKSNPELQAYTKNHNITYNQLHSLFMNITLPLLGNRSVPIVWQDVFDEDVPLSKDTLIQVWRYEWITEMIKILEAGHRLLFSSSWYLDYLNMGWETFYRADPRQMVYNNTHNDKRFQNIVGGESCMWGEMADDTNIISRTWPRTSAVAERLWTGLDYKAKYFDPVTNKVRSRLEEHTCRMNRRGIHAEPPNGPGFCVRV